LNKKPIYLSPDASEELLEIDPDAAYVIGGLVDRTVIKNASLNRAE
jgi:tRNA (guanine9-N1)-methyltransferase